MITGSLAMWQTVYHSNILPWLWHEPPPSPPRLPFQTPSKRDDCSGFICPFYTDMVINNTLAEFFNFAIFFGFLCRLCTVVLPPSSGKTSLSFRSFDIGKTFSNYTLHSHTIKHKVFTVYFVCTYWISGSSSIFIRNCCLYKISNQETILHGIFSTNTLC